MVLLGSRAAFLGREGTMKGCGTHFSVSSRMGGAMSAGMVLYVGWCAMGTMRT